MSGAIGVNARHGRCAAVLVGVIAAAWWTAGASGGVPAYQLVGTFELPSSTMRLDALPDGRLIGIDGSQISIQSAVNASGFAAAGSLPAGLVGQFGASFIRVNPSGSVLAIGDNDLGARSQEVFLLAAASLSTLGPTTPTIVACDNFEAAWADDATLFVSGASGFTTPAGVTRIDATSLTSPATQLVIDGIEGAAGGVAVRDGNLYTANGFDFGPGGSGTGEIREVPLSSLGNPIPINFEADGTPVADALSGNTLHFDVLGNLIVSGGDFATGDNGFVAVIDGDAILAAQTGGPMAPDSAEQRLSPAGSQFYSSLYNPATQEILVTAFGSTTVWRYAIPAPGSAVVMILGGAAALRRRR